MVDVAASWRHRNKGFTGDLPVFVTVRRIVTHRGNQVNLLVIHLLKRCCGPQPPGCAHSLVWGFRPEAGFSRVPSSLCLTKLSLRTERTSHSRRTFQLSNVGSHKILVPFRSQRIAIFLWGIPRSVEETSGSLLASWAFVFPRWFGFHILYLLWRDNGASAEVRVRRHLSFPRSEP